MCRTDTLWECFFAAWAQDISLPIRAVVWLLRGRTTLKRELAQRAHSDLSALPWNESVLDALRTAREEGRTCVLATAAHRNVADACAQSIGVFDRVFATDDSVNLKSHAKARALSAAYGERGFDYVGDSRADIAVWAASRRAFSVSSIRPPGVLALGEMTGGVSVSAWTRLLRIRHWIKNSLVFVALFAAHHWADPLAWVATIQTVIAFCAVCSGIYVFNDLFDLRSDRSHPSKKLRPLACGIISLATATCVAAMLLFVGLGIAFYVNIGVGLTVLAYCVVNALYTLHIKRIAVADVSVLAVLYTLRIVAGAAAIAVPLSPWLFAFSVFAFLSLALLKRAVDVNRLQPDECVPGRGYTGRDANFVNVFGAATSIAAIVVLSLYVASPQIGVLYASSYWLWIALAIVLYWLMRMWQLAMSGRGQDDPVLFATQDVTSWLCAAACGICFVLAL